MERVSGSGEDGLIRCSITDSVNPQGRSKATSIRDARISTTLVHARNWCPQPGFMLMWYSTFMQRCMYVVYLVYTWYIPKAVPTCFAWESAAIQRGLV